MNKGDKEMPVGPVSKQQGMTSMERGKADWSPPRLSTLEIVAETLQAAVSGTPTTV